MHNDGSLLPGAIHAARPLWCGLLLQLADRARAVHADWPLLPHRLLQSAAVYRRLLLSDGDDTIRVQSGRLLSLWQREQPELRCRLLLLHSFLDAFLPRRLPLREWHGDAGCVSRGQLLSGE